MASCSHYYNQLKWSKQTIDGLNIVLADYQALEPQLTATIPLLESFSSSLLL